MAPCNVDAADASKLYFEAEKAIQESEGNFRSLKAEWANAKKIISSNLKESSRADDKMKSIEGLLSDSEIKLEAEVAEAATNTQQLESVLQSLTAATQAKYADAEAASAVTTTKPGVIAKKFQDAKNAAAVADRETASLKLMSSMIEKSKDDLEKLREVIAHTKDSGAAIVSGRSLQAKGLELMEAGLSKVYTSCEETLYFCDAKENDGMSVFTSGIDMLSKANEKFFSKTLTQIRMDDNNLRVLDKSLVTLRDSLNAQTEDLSNWEKESKLSARGGKNAISATSGRLSTAANSMHSVIDKYAQMISELSSLVDEDRIGLKAAKSTLGSLERAEQTARRAERELRKAKEVGEKEASKYLKKAAKSKIMLSSGSISASTFKDTSKN
jgi:cob(I)alamin adenosyltransferase